MNTELLNRYSKKTNKYKVLNKTGGYCSYCGRVLDDTFHIDHLKPKCLGGSNNINNYVPACWRCNLSKGKRSLRKYREVKALLDEYPVYIGILKIDPLPFYLVEPLKIYRRHINNYKFAYENILTEYEL